MDSTSQKGAMQDTETRGKASSALFCLFDSMLKFSFPPPHILKTHTHNFSRLHNSVWGYPCSGHIQVPSQAVDMISGECLLQGSITAMRHPSEGGLKYLVFACKSKARQVSFSVSGTMYFESLQTHSTL